MKTHINNTIFEASQPVEGSRQKGNEQRSREEGGKVNRDG